MLYLLIFFLSDITDIEVILSDLSLYQCIALCSALGQKEAEICLSFNLADSGYLGLIQVQVAYSANSCTFQFSNNCNKVILNHLCVFSNTSDKS